MKRFLHFIEESWLAQVPGFRRGNYVDVFKNPSKAEINKEIRNKGLDGYRGAVTAWVSRNILIAWGIGGFHEDVGAELGGIYQTRHFPVYLLDKPAVVKFSETVREGTPYWNNRKLCFNNKVIARALGTPTYKVWDSLENEIKLEDL